MAMVKTAAAKNVDAYIKQFPPAVQAQLQQLRKTIKAAAPKATELISYQMPAYQLNGMLVYFAAYQKHIGFYPTGSGIEAFKKEIAAYKWSKGAVQFPLGQPLPLALVTQMVQFKVQANADKAGLIASRTKKAPAVLKSKATKKAVPDDAAAVAAYMDKLAPEVKNEIDAVRKIIKSAGKKLSERIKWNAPSYYYKEDIVTFGPYKTHKLLLVFHHPAVVTVKSNLLQGNYKDRRLVYFKDKAEAVKNKKELVRIINEIIKVIDKK